MWYSELKKGAKSSKFEAFFPFNSIRFVQFIQVYYCLAHYS